MMNQYLDDIPLELPLGKTIFVENSNVFTIDSEFQVTHCHKKTDQEGNEAHIIYTSTLDSTIPDSLEECVSKFNDQNKLLREIIVQR